MEKLVFQGDNPKARFGHSLTLVCKSKAILFGGAIGDSTQYSITNDIYSLDLNSLGWKKINPQGKKPSPRAAHSACAIELYHLMVYGGATGGGGLSSDELFLLDLKKGEENAFWVQIVSEGQSPGARYGHSLLFIKPCIYVFGGNSGVESLNDIWSMNLEMTPYIWHKIEINKDNPMPPPRAYHSAAVCLAGTAKGMILIHGGRDNSQKALNDSWGLIKHRNGAMNWIKAPHRNETEVKPTQRFQHNVLFAGALMLVIGGRKNESTENLPFEVYDTETSKWYSFLDIPGFRNGVINYNANLFFYGGFESSTPNIPTNNFSHIDLKFIFSKNKELSLKMNLNNDSNENEFGEKNVHSTLMSHMNSDFKPYKEFYLNSPTKSVKIAPMAIIAKINNSYHSNDDILKRIPLDNLQEEGKKININGSISQESINLGLKNSKIEELANYFLDQLLNPNSINKIFRPNKNALEKLCEETQKILSKEPSILNLTAPIKIFGNINGHFDSLINIFENFGYPDDSYGDIERNDYLFLGDYVDRGSQSLEVVCLLFALKLRFPEQIFLLRGHHEDILVNSVLGFGEECEIKMKEDVRDKNSIFMKINNLFQYLPFGAIVGKNIFCVHGGIGQNVKLLNEINKIQRPFQITHDSNKMTNEQLIVNELLWTDPLITKSMQEKEEKSSRSLFGCPEIRSKKFSMERTDQFLEMNNLSMMIRSHEFIKDGYENQEQKIVTFTSCFDYCGVYKNAGGIIYIKKNMNVCPKILYPQKNDSIIQTIKNEKIDNKLEKKDSRKLKGLSPLRN